MDLLLSDHRLYWHPDIALATMEGFLSFSSSWLRAACIGIALTWLLYRAYQVLCKPAEELIQLLGLEVPVAPVVSLAGVKADGVLLHWKPPENRATVAKYIIRVNGIDVGEVLPQETAVSITNLQPAHNYIIRVVTLNSTNFQAASVPLRVQTLPASSREFFNNPTKQESGNGDDDGYTPAPTVLPYKAFDVMLPPSTPPPMTREHSNSALRTKRIETGRRSTPPTHVTDNVLENTSVAPETGESLQKLTERLEALRREHEEVERQIEDEEEDFKNSKAAFIRERDELKQAQKEKEDASKEVRKQVAGLERQVAAAQARKAAQEKLLQQKQNERNRLRADIERRAREIAEMQEAVERMEREKSKCQTDTEKKIREARARLAEEQAVNKSLEDDIREKGITIHTLEEERKKPEVENGSQSRSTIGTISTEEHRQWHEKYTALQNRYFHVVNLFQQAEAAYRQTQMNIDYLNQRRAEKPPLFPPTQSLDGPPLRVPSQPRGRAGSLRADVVSNANVPGYVPSSTTPFTNPMTSASPTFTSLTSYMNINNGMTIPITQGPSFTQAEVTALTGGAPLSPNASALLPSDLFGNDMDRASIEDEEVSSSSSTHDPALGSSNLTALGFIPGLGAHQTSESTAPVQGPSRPGSPQSRSPSLFASPRESANHLANYARPASLFDTDAASVRSASSSVRAVSGGVGTRFGDLFRRQRGKTLSDDGPALGTLKGSQSHSMPRQDVEQDPYGTQRRRGSHSGTTWIEQMSSAFGRKQPMPEPLDSNPKHVATRRRPFNMFGSKNDPWLTSVFGVDRPPSPRPGSTTSNDNSSVNLLPRPSAESKSRFGWSIDDRTTVPSTLGADWGIPPNPWSRHPSRRPSVSQAAVPGGLGGDLLFDGNLEFPTRSSPTQAPIGTRPQSSQAQTSPTPPRQLNPAAPNFLSRIQFGKGGKEDDEEAAAERERKAAEKAEKAAQAEQRKAEKAKEAAEKKEQKAAAKAEKAQRKAEVNGHSRTHSSSDHHMFFGGGDISPTDTRKSRDRDARSISTFDSAASPRESLEHTLSNSLSDLAGTSVNTTASKESWVAKSMSKLGRKSSAGRILPSFGKSSGGGGGGGKKGNGESVEEGQERDGENGVLVSVNASPMLAGKENRSSSLSWSGFMRMGKKGERIAAPSEAASESEVVCVTDLE